MSEPTTPNASPTAIDERLTAYVRDAWGHALLAVNDAGDEVQRMLGRLSGWVEMRPDEARRVAHELAERLKAERRQIELAIDGAVRRSATPFRLPTREQVAAIDARLEAIEARLDRLAAKRRAR